MSWLRRPRSFAVFFFFMSSLGVTACTPIGGTATPTATPTVESTTTSPPPIATTPALATTTPISGTVPVTITPGATNTPASSQSGQLPAGFTVTSVWRAVASLPTARSVLGAAVGPDGRIYAIGGADKDGNAFDVVEAYDPRTDSWTKAASLPQALDSFAAVTGADGRIYVLGGENDNGDLGNGPIEIYSTTTNTWAAGAHMPTPRESEAAAVGKDGRIFAMGGCSNSTNSSCDATLGNVEAYTPSANTWTALPGLPTARDALAAATGTDGLIYAIGGEQGDGSNDGNVEVYNPTTTSWAAVTGLPTPRVSLAAVTGPDGRLYAIGGEDTSSNPLNTVEAYTPSTDAWTTLPGLPTARTELAAVVGPNGNIYAIGGSTGTNMLNTVEAYGPVLLLSSSAGSAGASVTVTGVPHGKGYLGNAETVHLYWDDPQSQSLASGATDGSGALSGSITFTVPATAVHGQHALYVIGDTSHTQVTSIFTVQ